MSPPPAAWERDAGPRGWCILAAAGGNGAAYITPWLGNEVKLPSTLLQELSEGLGAAGGLKGKSGVCFSGWGGAHACGGVYGAGKGLPNYRLSCGCRRWYLCEHGPSAQLAPCPKHSILGYCCFVKQLCNLFVLLFWFPLMGLKHN